MHTDAFNILNGISDYYCLKAFSSQMIYFQIYLNWRVKVETNIIKRTYLKFIVNKHKRAKISKFFKMNERSFCVELSSRLEKFGGMSFSFNH